MGRRVAFRAVAGLPAQCCGLFRSAPIPPRSAMVARDDGCNAFNTIEEHILASALGMSHTEVASSMFGLAGQMHLRVIVYETPHRA